jgi:hypothetical protein
MPEKASVARCLLAGMGMGIVWLGGIVIIFSTFRDPVIGGINSDEVPFALSLSIAAYLLADFLIAAGIPAALSPKYRSIKAAICLTVGSIVPIATLLILFLLIGNGGMLAS